MQAPENKAIVIAVANRKGGVGKTTGTAMLGTMLRLLGCRVLVIDNDPQANLTSMFGYTGYTGPNLYRALLEETSLQESILKTVFDPETRCYFDPRHIPSSEQPPQPGPLLIPITTDASNADFELKSRIDLWVYQMRDALAAVTPHLDYILIDCGPNLGTLTLNALAAADYVLIPVLPERVVVEGLASLLGVIASTRKRTNAHLNLAGIFFSMVQQNWRAHKEVKEELRLPERRQEMVHVLGTEYPPLHVFETEIRHNAALANSTNQRSLLVLDSADNIHTKAYWLLLAEILDVVGGAGQAKARQVVMNIQAESK